MTYCTLWEKKKVLCKLESKLDEDRPGGYSPKRKCCW